MFYHTLTFLTVSGMMSLIILANLGLGKLFPKLISAGLRYAAWLVILVGLIIPLRPMVGIGIFSISTPTASGFAVPPGTLGAPQEPSGLLPAGTLSAAEPARFAEPAAIDWQRTLGGVAAVVWAVVAVGMFIYHITRYVRFTKLIKRWGVTVTDESTLAVFRAVKKEKGILQSKIGLKKCGFVSTSMLVGFLRPVVILPENEFDREELELIFRHELIHYKRGDLFVKLLSVAAVSLHWFNPAVYKMNAVMTADCEASVDEAVLRESGGQNRQFYAELILEMIGGKKPAQTMLSTCFYAGRRNIEKRMAAIMDGAIRAGKPAFAALFAVAALTVFSGSVFAFNERTYESGAVAEAPFSSEADTIGASSYGEADTPAFISSFQARDIALGVFEGGTFSGFYFDEAEAVYRVEMLYGTSTVRLNIDAVNGELISFSLSEAGVE